MDFEMKYYDIMKGFRRIVIVAVVFAAAGISASAQLSFQGGVTLPIQTFEEPGSQGFASRYGDGMYIGIDYNIHVVKGFYITPGLDYNYLSVSYSGDISGFNGTEQQVDHWVNIPVNFKYEFGFRNSKSVFYLYAGPVFSFGAGSVTDMFMSNDELTVKAKYNNYSGAITDVAFGGTLGQQIGISGTAAMQQYLQSELDKAGYQQRSFDLRLDVGIGFRFWNHFEIRAGFTKGLIDRYKGAYSETYDMFTNQYYIGIGYRFGKRSGGE